VLNLPLSQEALEELNTMQHNLSVVAYDGCSDYSWTFIWGNATYSAQKLYKLAYSGLFAPPSVVWTSLGPLPWWVPGPTTRWAPGLLDVRYTAPVGVKHKDYGGEVLG
jgi:hypothetical protein